jgi:hypothetical protein
MNEDWTPAVVWKSRRVYGLQRPIPEGYRLVILSGDIEISTDATGISQNFCEIPSNYSLVKVCIALAQAVYAAITLY